MGYFSNGSEGENYYERFCSRCVHNIDNDCPVWNAHLLYSYRDCNDPESILHMLIPRNGAWNGVCRMFIEEKANGDLFSSGGEA